jgi:hypothetical protein
MYSNINQQTEQDNMIDNNQLEMITTITIEPFENMHKFLKLSYSERTEVINLGFQLYQQGKQIQLSNQNTLWQKQIDDIKHNHATTLRELSKERDELKNQIANLHSTFSSEKALLSSTITENAHATFKSQIDNMREQNNHLQTKLSNIETENRISISNQLKELREFYENKLEKQTAEFETIRNNYQEKLNSSITRTQNSTIKGKESEEEVFTALNQLFPTAIIEDTHTIPGRGDFILRMDDMIMMVETKNYTRNVQKSEVDKFYRDMESPANSDIQCGILMSMNCGISAREDFSLEVRSGKPLIFLHSIRDNMINIRLASHMFSLILGQKSLDLTSAEMRTRLIQLAKSIKTNYQKQKNHLDKYYQQSLTFIQDQQVNIQDLYNNINVKY